MAIYGSFPYKMIFPKLIWQISSSKKEVYLTFDDGPHPDVTPKVLKYLQQYNITATFFCVGENVGRYPEVFRQICDEGHQIGNHTYNHLNGWKTNNNHYYENIKLAAKLIKSDLFRPPYGTLRLKQARDLSRSGYSVIMWTILSRDFDKNLNLIEARIKLRNKLQPGAIVVFHDSAKAVSNLAVLLPEFIEYCLEAGYSFKSL